MVEDRIDDVRRRLRDTAAASAAAVPPTSPPPPDVPPASAAAAAGATPPPDEPPPVEPPPVEPPPVVPPPVVPPPVLPDVDVLPLVDVDVDELVDDRQKSDAAGFGIAKVLCLPTVSDWIWKSKSTPMNSKNVSLTVMNRTSIDT